MGRARNLINAIHSVRMNALLNPERYIQGFDKYDSASYIKEGIATILYLALSQL
jgi:hypothetical protein